MPKRRFFRSLIPLIVAIVAGSSAACDDPFSAFLLDVPTVPLEVTLFDFVTGRLEDPPAYDVIREITVRVDQTQNWDFLFRISGGTPELLPFAAVTDTVTDSGLIRAGTSFEGVLDAPTEGYTLSEPISIAVGDVLIARSRADASQFLACSRYAKLEILDLDVSAGSVTLRVLGNPNCGDTVLQPGTHGSL